MSREESVQHFLDLIKKSRRGKFKVYIGMIAGVGKTYRMLQEAHDLLDNGVDVNIGYVETHGRAGTEAVLAGLPVIPRRKIFYKGKELEEMDFDAIIRIHPEIVIVDELAHTNVEGSRNEKRWQDVMDLLDEGINVISAVNIQHIESINEEVQGISGIEVKERIPDSVLEEADEVVNIDLTAEELITRLKAGKIYKPDKVALALNNFFKTENILQLRELALKEVALRVEKKVENEVVVSCVGVRHEKFMACISSHEKTPRRIIRKAARLATRYNTSFVALYVQTPRESADRIALANQRHLLNHFKLVTELGGEVMQVQSKDVLDSIVTACKEKQITTVCMGSPSFALPQSLFMVLKYRKFVNELAQANIDLIILDIKFNILTVMNIRTKLILSVGVLAGMIILLVALSVVNLQILTATEPDSPAAMPGLQRALLWISITGGICILASIVLLVWLPRSINKPIRELTQGILEIANHNYEKRLDMSEHEEFREVADSFNSMAERLTEYRTSTLNDILSAKKFLEAIVNSIHEPIIGLNREHEILFVNKEALTVLNLKREDVIRRSAEELSLKTICSGG